MSNIVFFILGGFVGYGLIQAYHWRHRYLPRTTTDVTFTLTGNKSLDQIKMTLIETGTRIGVTVGFSSEELMKLGKELCNVAEKHTKGLQDPTYGVPRTRGRKVSRKV